MACYKHKKDPVKGYNECPGCEIERLRELNKVLEAGFFEAAKQIAKSDPAGVALWLREQGFMTQNAR